jgi:OPA family glycerol-3-phosphate transporter-like MFS transporter 1/2
MFTVKCLLNVIHIIIFVFIFSGYVAEHMDLRYFLTFGMFTSGIFTILFGLGYFWKIHNIAYFLTIQV